MEIVQIISGGATIDHKLYGPFGGSEEAAFLVGDVESKIPAADYEPSAIELLIHVLLYFFCYFLVVGPVVDCVADHVPGFQFGLWLQFGVDDLHAPLVAALVHVD
jgi:hypothetical protein